MSYLEDMGFALPTTAAPPPPDTSSAPNAPSVSVVASPNKSFLENSGFTLPTGLPPAKPSGQFSDEIPIPVPGTPDYNKGLVNARENADTLENRLAAFTKAIDPINVAKNVGGEWWDQTKQAASSGAAQYKSGLSDLAGGNEAVTSVSKSALGALAVPLSPFTGAFNTLGEGVAQVTGNKDAGDRAAFLAGLAIPVKGAPSVAKTVTTNKAINQLVADIGPANVPAVVAEMQRNPRLAIMDKSDPVRTSLQGMIDPAQPDAMNTVVSAVKDRMGTLPGAVNSAYTASMGAAPDTQVMLDALKQRARDAGQKAIQPALDNAKPVDTSPVIAAIDAQVKPGLQALMDPATRLPLSDLQAALLRVKQQLVAPTGETLTDANRLHQVQSALGDQAFTLQKSLTGSDKTVGNGLRDINEKLIDQIDQASGGQYRPARQQFKDAKDVSQAWEDGFDVLKNRSGVEGLQDRPEALERWMAQATPEEVVAKRLAVRSDIDQKINGVKNQVLAGTNITKIPYNQQKLSTLFGDKEAQRLTSAMDDAATEANTNSKILQGSKTAETLAAQQAKTVPKVDPFRPLSASVLAGPALAGLAEAGGQYLGAPGALTGAGIIGAGVLSGLAKKGVQTLAQKSALATNSAYAKYASATGGPTQAQALSALMSHPQVVSQLQKARNALTTP